MEPVCVLCSDDSYFVFFAQSKFSARVFFVRILSRTFHEYSSCPTVHEVFNYIQNYDQLLLWQLFFFLRVVLCFTVFFCEGSLNLQYSVVK